MRFLVLFALSSALLAEVDFTTGQAARLVIGQTTFTAQEGGASSELLGAVSGLAYVNDMLLVADSNRLNALPMNHRALIFKDLSQQLPGPLDELPVTSERCPVCGGTATVVLGQPEMEEAKLNPAGPDTLRTPTGIASDGVRVAVADTDNNRVLIWNSIPAANGQPADVVVGQSDFEGYTSTGFSPTANSLRGPQGVWFQDGRLLVADTGNNRVLIWNTIPTQNHQPADVVLGQKDFTSYVQPDLTKTQLEPQANTLLTPLSVTSDGQRLYVADLGHNRVLIWSSIPTQNQAPADLVVGQPDFESAIANNSPKVCAPESQDEEGNDVFPRRCGATLDFPRFALSDGQKLFIADGGNDRILVYSELPTENGKSADIVIGQITDKVNLVSDSAFPGDVASAGVVRAPQSLAWDGINLYASDPFNRRVMVFTMAERRVANTGVRNAASFEVFAVGGISFSGGVEEMEGDEHSATVTIRPGDEDEDEDGQREYTYTFKEDDNLADVTVAVAAVINDGEGDPEVYATANPYFATIILTAKIAGKIGNEIDYAAEVSIDSPINVATHGSTLRGGGEASKIAPGTIVSIVGDDLSDVIEAAPLQGASELPKEMGGVQVYLDGIRAPLYYVSPTQINAQMPVEAYDTQSVSAYVRTTHADGSVVASNAIAVPIIQFNPGIFAAAGIDPRPAVAVHSSSQATGVISVDGQASEGDVATAIIEDRRYSYTVKAEDVPAEDDEETEENEAEPIFFGLIKIRDALIALINQDPKVEAYAAGQFTRIRLRARIPGPMGNGIPYSTETNDDSTVILTATTAQTCCANVAGALITESNPALAGETITVYATGLGLVDPEEARMAQKTGLAYDGPELNEPVEFVSSLAGQRTANVLYTGLQRGMIGVYRIDLQLNAGLPTNPITPFTIAQGFQVSNIVTIAVFNSNPPE